MDTLEIWRKSPLAPDHVRVSNLGRVKTLDKLAEYTYRGKPCSQLRKGKVLSPWVANTGYQIVTIQIGESRKKYLVHRLVASAFCTGFDPSLSVNHIDGNKLNNIPSNLEWVTLGVNTKKQWETGLVNLRGENHPLSKLSNEEAAIIKESEGSLSFLAKRHNVSISLIHKIKQGRKPIIAH